MPQAGVLFKNAAVDNHLARPPYPGLLVKLPAERVQALIGAGHAEPFTPAG
jgi:hypothetical protein